MMLLDGLGFPRGFCYGKDFLDRNMLLVYSLHKIILRLIFVSLHVNNRGCLTRPTWYGNAISITP